MDVFDIKKERKGLYAPRSGEFVLVHLPEMAFLKHHEIYLGDPRKVEAAKLRTVLRQPVSAAD